MVGQKITFDSSVFLLVIKIQFLFLESKDGHVFSLQSKAEPMEEVREGNTAYQQGHCTGEDLALTLCMIAITLGWVSLLGSVLQRSTFPSTAQIPVEKVAGCIGGR